MRFIAAILAALAAAATAATAAAPALLPWMAGAVVAMTAGAIFTAILNSGDEAPEEMPEAYDDGSPVDGEDDEEDRDEARALSAHLHEDALPPPRLVGWLSALDAKERRSLAAEEVATAELRAHVAGRGTIPGVPPVGGTADVFRWRVANAGATNTLPLEVEARRASRMPRLSPAVIEMSARMGGPIPGGGYAADEDEDYFERLGDRSPAPSPLAA